MNKTRFLVSAGPLVAAVAAQSPGLKVTPAVDDPPVLAATLGKFGAELAAHAGKDANLCLSPASIGLCLLMTLPGARGATAAEVQKLLCPEGWGDKRALVAARMLMLHLRGSKTIELSVVCDLWPQAGHPLLPEFKTATWAGFDAEVRPQDFVGDPAGARKTINDHVAHATKDRITDLLSPDAVTKDTRLILTNAVYLKADWRDPFKGSDTKEGKFHLADGSKVDVQLMHRRGDYALAEVEGVQVMRMPYVDPEFAFDVALPGKGASLANAEASLRPESAAAWTPALKMQPVAVTLPRFRVEGSFRLAEALRALGLVQATTPNQADFSGIDGGAGRLYIAEVVHKTFLDVAEKGTEAAAATAVVMRAGSAMRPGATFTADRPFAFALRDLNTGLVLFAGRVGDPRPRKE